VNSVRAWSVDDTCEDATRMTMLYWKATPASKRHVWANVTWDQLKGHLDQAKYAYEQMRGEPPPPDACEASLAAYLEAIRFVAAHDELVLIEYPPR
jgi:hypothetical protein